MPQKSLITSLPGQEKAASSGSATTSLAVADSPLFEFPSRPNLGGQQSSQWLGTGAFASPVLSETAISAEKFNPAIPCGATLRPRLRLAISGRTPVLKTRQLWEGTVTEVRDVGFVAILSDKTNPRNPAEQATFEFDNIEISPEDQKLISPGS